MHITTAGLLTSILHILALCPSTSAAALDNPEVAVKPCTLHSPNTGAYFDLNTISVLPPEERDGNNVHGEQREESWHARGYDHGANFTINICAPTIEKLDDVVGVEKERWQNVSAFYKMDGKTYSIGQQSSLPIFRGRKLVLNYTDGSPCDETSHTKREIIGGGDEDGHKDEDKDKKPGTSRRKSTIMSFLCDRDLVTPAAAISFVGSLDHCTYVFEVRSAAACGGVAASADGGLGPAGLFGIIAAIAVAVYIIGGCVYQRTVMHQRGWRQIPNYSMWCDALGFLKDLLFSLFSSLSNCIGLNRLGSSRGYTHVSNGQEGGGRRGLVGAIGGRGTVGGRGSSRRANDIEEENRLIDQLDEEWDD